MAILQSSVLSGASGNTTAVTVSAKKEVYVQVFGTFGGGTVTITVAHNGSNFTTVGTGGVFITAGHCRVSLPVNASIRAELTGAAGAAVDVIFSE